MGLLVRVTSKNDSVSRGKHPMLVTHCEMRLQRLLHLKLSHPQILHDLQSSHARNQKEPKTNHWTLIPSCRWEKKSIIFTDTLLTNDNTFITGTVIKKTTDSSPSLKAEAFFSMNTEGPQWLMPSDNSMWTVWMNADYNHLQRHVWQPLKPPPPPPDTQTPLPPSLHQQPCLFIYKPPLLTLIIWIYPSHWHT